MRRSGLTVIGNNLKRLLADVVSVDAWHTPFDGETGIASLHVDVVFGEARIGGEREAPVRFRLALKRAEVVVVVPSSEPLEVQRGSVVRDQPEETIHRTRRSEGVRSGEIGINLQPKYPVAAASGGGLVRLSAGRTTQEILESDEQLKLLSITQRKSDDGHYSWDCVPSLGTKLQGRPWDAQTKPRLKVKDIRANSKHLAGGMRVQVRCRREDLSIEDIEIKDESLLARIKAASLLANKKAAVEAYLKHLLSEQRLHFDNIDDPYGHLHVADVTVEESQS